MRRRRGGAERIGRWPARQRPLAVDRLAHGVDDPPEPARGRAYRAGERTHDRAAAAPHAFERRERHQQRVRPGEAHNLAGNRPAGRRLDQHARADRHGVDRASDLDHEAAHADHPAIDFDAVELRDLLGQRLHEIRMFMKDSGSALTDLLPASLIIASPSLGLSAHLPGQDGGASRGSRLTPTLNVEHEPVYGRKTNSLQHITAIRSFSPSKCLDTRIRFC